MIFVKLQSLTHKIDTMIIHDIKREMPLEYGLHRVAEWLAKLVQTGIFCTFIIYLGFAISTPVRNYRRRLKMDVPGLSVHLQLLLTSACGSEADCIAN